MICFYGICVCVTHTFILLNAVIISAVITIFAIHTSFWNVSGFSHLALISLPVSNPYLGFECRGEFK